MFCWCKRKKKDKVAADPVVEAAALDVNESVDETQVPIVDESPEVTTADSETYKEEVPK